MQHSAKDARESASSVCPSATYEHVSVCVLNVLEEVRICVYVCVCVWACLLHLSL
jgi:hypothetical protein